MKDRKLKEDSEGKEEERREKQNIGRQRGEEIKINKKINKRKNESEAKERR